MSKAIEEIKSWEDQQRLARLAAFQSDFLQRYAKLIADDRDRDDFRRDLLHLIHLIYREAQEPLVKQLTDFVLTHSQPFVIESPKP